MAAIFVEEVFKRSGVPTHTFVEPSEFPDLKVSLRTPGRGVIVEGPSGIGKSTAVSRALATVDTSNRVQPLSARKPEDVDYILLLPELVDFGVVVIDDFHILPEPLQRSLADLLKTLADEESSTSKLVIVGINRAGESLVRHAPDLTNRLDVVKFELEPNQKVGEVIALGERALNIYLEARENVVEAARGSFYLAQMLCHELCLADDLSEAHDGINPRVIRSSYSSVRGRVMDRQRRRFGQTVERFARGNKFRPGGRAPYLFLLKWLAESPDGSVSLSEAISKHLEHRASVRQVVDKGYLKDLVTEVRTRDILYYDEVGRVLSIEDPHLAFYLRNQDWRRFATNVGFTSIDIEQAYDFALSFAGEDRQFAERLAFHLEDLGCVVFYDMNEQHRIVAKELEAFLGPIYEADAALVIAILGPQYGERRWTRFESKQFTAHFDDGRVIPIWSRKASPTAFDRTLDIGGLQYDPESNIDDQARAIAKVCVQKQDDPLESKGRTSLATTGGAAQREALTSRRNDS